MIKKIINIGPVSESPEMIEGLIRAGMDIARMNFSHCTIAEFKTRKERIVSADSKLGTTTKILQDLKGPRLRVGNVPDEGIELKDHADVVFSTDSNNHDAIYISDPYLHTDIKAGDPLFLASGLMELVVTEVSGATITATVIRGGRLFPNKGVNVPRTKLTTSGLTEKDIEDVKFGLSEGVDYIALSFVQTADDIHKLRDLVGDKAKIIAKIESAIALDHLDEIVRASDGIMVARGDLGVELPMEKVPFVQKYLIKQAHWHGKFSIVATQMLASMIDHPHPTRAEVSDIANAVLDGADAVTLSDETSIGSYPIQAVEVLSKVVLEAENHNSNTKGYL